MSIRILHLDSSLFGDKGASSQLGNAMIQTLKQTYPDAEVVYRDLAEQDITHFSARTIEQISDGKALLADQLIAELQAADLLVIGAPMYNFSIPSTLKAWIDHVARAGTTFKYTESGPVGLLDHKKVVVLTTRGGIHRDQPSDLVVPYLKVTLGFLGLDDVHFVYAEGLAMPEYRDAAMAKAHSAVNAYIQAQLIEEKSV